MQQYNEEAATLTKYMKNTYNIECKVNAKGLVDMPLRDRWLRGEEYAFLLRHYKTYHKLEKCSVNLKCQDSIVYENP